MIQPWLQEIVDIRDVKMNRGKISKNRIDECKSADWRDW